MANLWQQPHVNVFKHYSVTSWKKAAKEGEVTTLMDKTVKATVLKITGHIPAGNFIQLPRVGSHSLGLTGRYFYLLFRPIPTKYFVIHVDVVTHDSLVIRLSFSNLFKEFKSTSTWLQFPFLCNASRETVAFYTSIGAKEHGGPAPSSTRWTILCLDLSYILSTYLNRRYSHIKSMRLCANMFVKNVFTSDIQYDPNLSLSEAKKMGGGRHMAPLPREFGFPVQKGDTWNDLYDLMRFPPEGDKKPFDSIQYAVDDSNKDDEEDQDSRPRRIQPSTQHVSKCVSERVSMIHKLTSPKPHVKKPVVTKELPELDIDSDMDQESNVHIYAHPLDPDDEDMASTKPTLGPGARKEPYAASVKQHKKTKTLATYKTLEPDPILKLKRIVGFGGGTYKEALWSGDRSCVIYPCHAVVVVMKVSNGHQRVLLGHTGKVSCLSLNGNSTLLASGQTGQMAVVRIWKYQTGECMAVCKTHSHSLFCLSFAQNGNALCGVGKDGQGKNMVVIWSTCYVLKKREVTILAKAHTDVDITRMVVAPFDETRMVSCGRDNVRFWRVKDGTLRSAPVNLNEYHSMEFTGICFECGYHTNRSPEDRLIYACSRSGHVFEIDYKKVAVHHVRRLLPIPHRTKGGIKPGTGLAITSISINETFCATGSEDGFLRLWPLDFAHVYLEAEHEGPVTSVCLSADGLKILAGTGSGNLGILDVGNRDYTTIMRSHTSTILSAAIDPYRKHLATVSSDHSIRVWDAETLQQLYDFSAPKECPTTICYHPNRQIFVCGFESGVVRVFNVQSTCLVAEHAVHKGSITGVLYSPNGDFLYTCCSQGSIASFSAADEGYPLLRIQNNMVARGKRFAPDMMSISDCGRKLAFVGPSNFTVTVVSGGHLSELLRVDVTNLNPDREKEPVDTAVHVTFTPSKVGHLLVATSNNRLLKLDHSGKLVAEVNGLHRMFSRAKLLCSSDGRYLITAGDKVLKVWDYLMKLDINFQVFIGHSDVISKVLYTPDEKNVISVGEAIYIWDNLALRPPTPPIEGRMERTEDKQQDTHHPLNTSGIEFPRHTPPRPVVPSQPSACVEDLSSIQNDDDINTRTIESDAEGSPCTCRQLLQKNFPGEAVPSSTFPCPHSVGSSRVDQSVASTSFASKVSYSVRDMEDEHLSGPLTQRSVKPSGSKTASGFVKHSPHQPRPRMQNATQKSSEKLLQEVPSVIRTDEPSPPTCCRHFKAREKQYSIAQRRYTAPPNQSGLRLSSIIGYNGNGRDNMVWSPDTGLFAYTSGNVVVLEDLSTGQQSHLQGHNEEISTIAVQHDNRVLVSACGVSGENQRCQICVWDLVNKTCQKTVLHHKCQVVCMAFSRDDRFLLTVGDYRDREIVVWGTPSYTILTSVYSENPVHCIKWDPYSVDEFSTVGDYATVCFWMLDETGKKVTLSVMEGLVPEELRYDDAEKEVAFTNMEFTGDSTLFVATSTGKVSAWDTRHNSCFMHWDADHTEIDAVVSSSNKLITGSSSGNLRLWSMKGTKQMKEPGVAGRPTPGHGVIMEDEMTLDGGITAANFDENLEMGIVGTTASTLWYINWVERTSIRLISGHSQKVTGVAMTTGGLMATGSADGSVRVWVLHNKEQALQFQVKDRECNCVAFAPAPPQDLPAASSLNENVRPGETKVAALVAGYSDGTLRMFDVNTVEMQLKLRPHSVPVNAVAFSADGCMIISGANDGVIAVSSPVSGMTVKVINDHRGAPITDIDVAPIPELADPDPGIKSPQLWLACSADRRVSIWSTDWGRDVCDLVDWLTFPAPAFTLDGEPAKGKTQYAVLPTSLARFSLEEPDVILYTGYGMNKCIQFYSISQRKVLRSVSLTHWARCIDICPDNPLIAVGINEHLLKLTDYYEGSFQDFTSHDTVSVVRFSRDGTQLVSTSHGQILVWDITL